MVPASGVGKLMAGQIRCRELIPPMAARTRARLPSKRSRETVRRRVNDPDRDVVARELNRKAQVAVVGDDDRGIDSAGEYVDEQVGGDVDVGALLLPVRGTTPGTLSWEAAHRHRPEP